MKKEIKIPEIAENVDTGIIAGILVSEGDNVSKDQSILEVETDKAATDIPSPDNGKVQKIMVSEGDEVSVNQVVMILEISDSNASGDDASDDKSKNNKGDNKSAQSENSDTEKDSDDEEVRSEEEPQSEKTEKEDKEEEQKKESDNQQESRSGSEQKETETSSTDSERPGEDIPASPSVRRKAREAGIRLSEIKGSGPGNRITSEDIEKAKEQGKDRESTGKERSSKEGDLPDFSTWGPTEKQKLNTIRRITGRTMTQSWQEIPQVTQFDEADITDLEAFRQKKKDTYEKQGGKLTLTAILVKVATFGLQKFPRFNSSIDTSDDTLIMKRYYNIGLAVDTDKGLIVPVVKDAERKSLLKISGETAELAQKARENKISPEELKGGNFTISNLGGIGGTAFTPIVYSPQVAILGVSKASFKQVYMEEEFRKRLILPLSLTYDHRVIDGAEGAKFLKWVCDVLEDPYALLQ